MYFEKCTFDYSVKFNQWRIRMLGENSGVDREAMRSRYDMILKKEEFLFKGTEFIDEDGTVNAFKEASKDSTSSPTTKKKSKNNLLKKGAKNGG